MEDVYEDHHQAHTIVVMVMNLMVELIHNGQSSHLTSRTRVTHKQKPKFRVCFTHCGTDWWWNCMTKPSSLRCMCQTCGASGVGTVRELP